MLEYKIYDFEANKKMELASIRGLEEQTLYSVAIHADSIQHSLGFNMAVDIGMLRI